MNLMQPTDNHEAMLFLSSAIVKTRDPESMDVLISAYHAVYFAEYGMEVSLT